MIGKTLGHYRVGEQLGRGGMGEVYLADDLSLDRKVALKFLPDAFVGDPERMARFEREAKLLASLNHPNIAAIYGLEQAEAKRFIVMELVEGETLAQRLSKGALPIDEALGICKQIAEGLEAAHEKGVIHRDLKPANVMITEGDKIKILDFGLAKALSDETQSVDSSHSPTLTEAMTRPGVILGTAAYMSPEQAKGKSVDKRADIWAFGCILYECLTGKRAFEGETVTETLAAILKGEPDWQALPSTTPPNIRFVLRRCLERDVGRRFRDAADVRIEIDEARATGEAAVPAKKSRIAWGIAIACFVVALALAALHLLRAPAETPQLRLEAVTPATSEPTSLAISPDGRLLVYAASAEGRERLWLRSLDATGAKPLPGTEGAVNPFWSPDSRLVGFFAEGKLKRIDISGGQRQTLTSIHSGFGGTWNHNGVIVYARSWGSPLYRIPASGGEPVAITRLDSPKQTAHSFPQFLPDGRHLLYFARGSDKGIYLASLDSTETRRLIAADWPGAYAAPGYLLFIREGILFAQRFSPSKGDFVGDPTPIADSVATNLGFVAGGFSVSETGMLAFRTAGGTPRRQLTWFDRAGNEVGKVGAPDENEQINLNFSADGRRTVVQRTVQGNCDIWLIDTAQGTPIRFTFDAGDDVHPIGSHDGSRILFSSNRKGIFNIYQKASSGTGNEELLLESTLNKFPCNVSPDGRFLIYLQADERTRPDLWVLPLSGKRKPFPFTSTPFDERNGQFSPNAQWVTYESNESGQSEIYVQSFPGPGGKRQVSAGGGTEPRWRNDGKELFYIALDGKLMAVPIHSEGQTLEAGNPHALFQTRIVRVPIPQKWQYAIGPDGQRFLINTIATEPTAPPITIIANWTRALKK